MGIFLKVIGIISIVIGIIFILTLIGAPVGVSIIIQGVVLFALGSIYDGVKEIQLKIKKDERKANNES